MEIGPGRGDFLTSLAREFPHKKFAAIEYKKKRFEKLSKRLGDFPNVLLHLGNARQLIPELYNGQRLETIYILFPDPWPKRRHAKHRLFQEKFLQALEKGLRPAGQVVIATDDPLYRDQIRALFEQNRSFRSLDFPFSFPTFYAEKWRKEGRSLFSLIYEKVIL